MFPSSGEGGDTCYAGSLRKSKPNSRGRRAQSLHPPTLYSSLCQKFLPSTYIFRKSKGEPVDAGSEPNCGWTVLLQQSWRSFIERFSGRILLLFLDHASKMEESTKKEIINVIENKKNNKKFWEELVAYFPLIGYRPNEK
jgi:hypothetical protein